MRGEMAQQDAQWKEAYEVLLAENNVLKSSGSEALLASQWRQRYEVSLKEKEDMENKLKMERQKSESTDAGGKYELKYRDLKESFRLYRKKAKEIFEAQQSGEHGVRTRIRFLLASWSNARRGCCCCCCCCRRPFFLTYCILCLFSLLTAPSIIESLHRRCQTFLLEKSHGELFDFGYSGKRTYGRCHWNRVAVHSG